MNEYIENQLFIIPRYLPLKDYQIDGEYHILDIGGKSQFKKLRLNQLTFEIVKLFASPNTPKTISEVLKTSIQEVVSFCRSLLKEGLLEAYHPEPEIFTRYSRHLQYFGLNSLDPIKAQETLSNLTITLIGVGGIGNWIGLNLVGLGIKKIKLIDPDVIEDSNLPRQVLFNESDKGKFKVDIAEREILKRNHQIIVESFKNTISSENISDLIKGSDFVVLSADKPFFQIQKWSNDACIKENIPLLNVGYAANEGVMGPMVIPGKSACLACNGYLEGNNYYLKNKNEKNPLGDHYITPSFVCLNSLISSMASYEIVKYFLGLGECITINNSVYIDPANFGIKKFFCEKNQKCKACK